MKSMLFKGLDGAEFNVEIWDEVANPKAVLQISHGMAEYAARYDGTALEFNKAGYIVIADDHRGHGKTVGFDKRGVTSGNPFFDTIDDLSVVTKYAKETYKLPVILLGHSYGSFLSQGYIEKYGDLISAVILSGSAYMHTSLVGMGKKIIGLQAAFINGAKPAKLIEKMSFGSYDKPFPADERPFAWLSRDKDEVAKYRADDFCGHTMSINFQNSFMHGVHSIYTADKLGAIPKALPILILSGSLDPVGAQGKLVKQLFDCYKGLGINRVEMKLYENGRHEILNETNREEVRSDIVNFINSIL